MKRLTTDFPDGNFETVLNFVYGKDGWAHIRHDGEHEDVRLTEWTKQQCKLHGCDDVLMETPEEIDAHLFDCMLDCPICSVAMAYCFASQAVHLRSRLKMHENTMPLERAQELAQAEKDGRLVVLPCKIMDTIFMAVGRYRITGFEEDRCDGFFINREGILQIKAQCYSGNHATYGFPGETVFLTQEEAEAALKKREDTI